ncbi:MAG: biopolymer transporter ExbB [Rhodobacteraceae bacterium]|nr:biopolymer transporter ExbB [Paracoccaceae bacterium]
MKAPERTLTPRFTRPTRQIVTMLLVVAAFVAGAYVAYPRVAPVFLANPWLNGVIGGVFVFGVLACFWQVLQLFSSVGWIESFVRHRDKAEMGDAPRLLAPLAALLGSRGATAQIGASSARSILDSVATRIDEARDITRYIVNLLIFLGLLGTFYGLATTVPAVVDTIRSLAPQDGEESSAVFARLIGGLERQLGGMGTAFASSLLGLAGSLVVGLLELLASHGQNRFYRELEEWLSTFTRLGFAGPDGEGDATPEQAMLGALLEAMDSQVVTMQAVIERSDETRDKLDARLGEVAASVAGLGARLEADDGSAAALARIAEGQERLNATLEALAVREETGGDDAETRMRLRSIDVQMLRILEELSAGRQETLGELRHDLKRLTDVIERATGDGGG